MPSLTIQEVGEFVKELSNNYLNANGAAVRSESQNPSLISLLSSR